VGFASLCPPYKFRVSPRALLRHPDFDAAVLGASGLAVIARYGSEKGKRDHVGVRHADALRAQLRGDALCTLRGEREIDLPAAVAVRKARNDKALARALSGAQERREPVLQRARVEIGALEFRAIIASLCYVSKTIRLPRRLRFQSGLKGRDREVSTLRVEAASNTAGR
jgi:hypothetical protein